LESAPTRTKACTFGRRADTRRNGVKVMRLLVETSGRRG
jgi:hypothetical protein